AAAAQPRESLSGPAKDPRQADATPCLTRPRRTAGPCSPLESTLRHRPLAVLFHEPEVSRRIHDLHLGTPRFPLIPRRTEVVGDNLRTKAGSGHRETMQSAHGIDLHFPVGTLAAPFREPPMTRSGGQSDRHIEHPCETATDDARLAVDGRRRLANPLGG